MIFVDVDNTLLDNDRVIADLKEFLVQELGPSLSTAYWETFERLRSELGYADYLGALQRLRNLKKDEQGLFAISRYLLHYPFADRLYPNALEAITYLQTQGQVAILSDGDVVFQPLKIERSGLKKAVNDNVMIYIHKEQELSDIARRFPADHYTMVDDKIRILSAMKEIWKDKLTTVFVKQGHYAMDAKLVASFPKADVEISSIGEITKSL